MKRLIVYFLLYLSCPIFSVAQKRLFDDAQARAMLSLLEVAAHGQVAPEIVNQVLDSKGTALIVEQMNASRRVTLSQYKTVLLAFAAGQHPKLDDEASDPRAKRGIEGLKNDVFPSLLWGAQNAEVLRRRLDQANTPESYVEASKLALKYLPEPVSVDSPVYIVMGGRAGAASVDDGIYFDVLANSYKAAIGGPGYPSRSEILEYFAHEMHHTGLERIIKHVCAALKLNDSQTLAFDMLKSLVMEGSATYLINGHRNLDTMKGNEGMFGPVGKSGELLVSAQQVLQGTLDGKLRGDAYSAALAPFTGNGWHAAGAAMFSAIDHAGGLKAVMAVLRDPRQLPAAYNRAIQKTAGRRAWKFDPALAHQIARMGS